MDDNEQEFTQFKHLELKGLPPYNRISVAVGSYPSFRLVQFQLGPINGFAGSDHLVGLTRTDARRLANWILEQVDG